MSSLYVLDTGSNLDYLLRKSHRSCKHCARHWVMLYSFEADGWNVAASLKKDRI
uniref:Uncharacterized protein n=1 Tax=Arundo donax TaxID=35708 RepID=A0A0A8YQ39_ARUDO